MDVVLDSMVQSRVIVDVERGRHRCCTGLTTLSCVVLSHVINETERYRHGLCASLCGIKSCHH